MGLFNDYREMFEDTKQPKSFLENKVENKKTKDIDYYLNQPEGKKQMLEIVHDIVESFNYENVHKAMVALDWEWFMWDGNRIPTEKELKDSLLEKFIHLFEEKCDTISSGGFTVGYTVYGDDAELHESEPDDFKHSVDVYCYFAIDDYHSLW